MSDTSAEDRKAARIELAELGPLGIRHYGAWTAVRGERTAVVLTVLSLAGLSGARTEELIEAAWPPPGQPATARQSLANVVSRLRSAHGQDFIEPTGSGYRLREEVSSDRVAFLREVDAAAETLDSDPSTALALVERAMGRWRGDPWVGLERPEQLEADRSRLLDARHQGQRLQALALAALGRTDESIPVFEAVVDENPLDEAAWRSLAAALGAGGRRAEALRKIALARSSLGDSGLDVGSALAELEAGLLVDHAAQLLLPEMPEPRTPFIGRSAELVELGKLLEARRLVMIHGPGGAGKTRLAIAAAEESDRACGFVRLVDAVSGTEIDLAFARGLGVPLDRIEALSGVDRRRALLDSAAAFDGVLVVDNCEHVLADAREVIDGILDASDAVTVLATSRVQLGLPGEFRYRIPELVESAELMRDRAAAWGSPHLSQSDNEVITTICEAVDQLPLAIELAAAQLPYRSLAEIAAELSAGAEHLDRSQDDGRHQTMDATLRWSHDRLEPEVRDAFPPLGVFPGVFSRPDAAAVMAVADPEQALDEFVRRSLVERTNREGESVYRLLAPVRQFALSELRRTEYDHRVELLLADWFLQLTDRPYGDVWWRWSVADELAPRLPAAIVAIEALAKAGRVDHATVLAARFGGAGHLFGYTSELIELLQRLGPLAANKAAKADALVALGVCGISAARNDVFAAALGELDHMEGIDHLHHTIFAPRMNALWVMWGEYLTESTFDQSLALLDAARQLERELGSPNELAAIEMFECWVRLLERSWDLAVEAGRRAMSIMGPDSTYSLTSAAGVAYALVHLGEAEQALEQARTHPERSRYTYWGDPLGIAECAALISLGEPMAGLDRLESIQQRAATTSFALHVEDAGVATAFAAHLLGRDDVAMQILQTGARGRGPHIAHLGGKICADLDTPLVAVKTGIAPEDRIRIASELRRRNPQYLAELRLSVS